MLQLAWRIQRVHVDLHGTGPCNTQEGDGKRQKVGQHHRNAVALFDTQALLQPRRKGRGLAVHVGIAQGLAESPEGGAVGELRHRRFEHVHDRRVGVGIDRGRDVVGAVGGEPGFGSHQGISGL